MSYLLGITIGPVQAYIEESRKLSDLKNSSKIISDIVKEILNAITRKDTGSNIVYPNHSNRCKDIDYSNYAIVEIQKSDINIKEIIDNVYKKLVNNINEKLGGSATLKKDEINEIFHLFWAKVTIDKTNYYESYKKLTRLLRSLKNTYEFEQLVQESGKKCLICGKHNVTDVKDKNEIKIFNLSYNEQLCKFCLGKRIYSNGNDKSIESVYSIAIKRWFKNNEDVLKELNEKLVAIFGKNKKYKYFSKEEIKQDINLLSKGNEAGKSKAFKELNDDLINEIQDNDKQRMNDTQKKLEEVFECMNILYKNVFAPIYEYSFIQFDVDNLGKWMSGKYLNSEEKENLKEYQKFISECLSVFVNELRNRLSNECTVIYSGGDDFLGVIPNEDIIAAYEIIEELFETEVRNKIKERYKKIYERITYSMSITIAQCKDPMSYALKRTREELEKVKTRFESKDGVAITYIINNGKEITGYLRKEEAKELFNIVNKVKDIKKHILFSYINKFETEFSSFKFEDITFDEMQNYYKILACEFNRLFSKSIPSMKEEDDDKKALKSKVDVYKTETIDFISSVINHNCIEISSNHESIDFNNIINILKLSKKLYEIEFRNCEGEKM